MSDSATLTVQLSSATGQRLAQLAGYAGRTQSLLAAEAIESYVERELEIIEGIERGRRDVQAGRVATHAEVVSEARAIIDAARSRR